jgi:alanine racemase
MAKAQETVLELDFNALERNYNYLKSKLQENTKFLAVVKAFAYGSDAEQIALHLQNLNADYFAVAYTSEGVALRDAGITKPILVLHPQTSNFQTIINRCLEPSLYNANILNAFHKVAKGLNQENYPVHIKFNTGLNRLGFWENDVDYVVSKLGQDNSLFAKSIFSHLAASEDLDEHAFTEAQISNFKSIAEKFSKSIGYKPLMHICNTSGVLNYPEAHFDMVRCGIGLYGFGNSEKENKHFVPIATLKTIISQIHNIEEGETVGYNRAYKSSHYKKIATIPIGHADGIGRQYGNGKGFVYINNVKVFIVGNVCMDMIMIDISHIDCKEGDEVVIFDQNHTAEALAKASNTISYELITSISQRIKRKYKNSI